MCDFSQSSASLLHSHIHIKPNTYEWEEEEEEEEDEEQDEGFWSPDLWMRKQQQPENISPEIAALDLDGMKQTRRALFLEK